MGGRRVRFSVRLLSGLSLGFVHGVMVMEYNFYSSAIDLVQLIMGISYAVVAQKVEPYNYGVAYSKYHLRPGKTNVSKNFFLAQLDLHVSHK